MMEVEEWNENIQNWLNSTERQTIEIISRTAAILTVFGASYIIQDITKDATRRKETKNRIISFMSFCDLIAVFLGTVLSTVMVPKDIGVPGARGNQLSCTIQGLVINVFGPASGLYNVTLAIFYLLLVRFDYSDEKLRKLEPFFLYIPFVLSLIIAVPGGYFKVYNFSGQDSCTFNVSPLNCDKMGSPIECERGQLYYYWRYTTSCLLFSSAVIIVICMVMMYKAVLGRERSGDRFRFRPTSTTTSNSNPRRTLSNAMKSQGMWYSVAFLFTFFPLLISPFWNAYPRKVLAAFTLNLIGFTNAVIYIRPRLLKFRRDHPNIGFCSSVWYTLIRSNPSRATGTSTNRTTSSGDTSIGTPTRGTIMPSFLDPLFQEFIFPFTSINFRRRKGNPLVEVGGDESNESPVDDEERKCEKEINHPLTLRDDEREDHQIRSSDQSGDKENYEYLVQEEEGKVVGRSQQ